MSDFKFTDEDIEILRVDKIDQLELMKIQRDYQDLNDQFLFVPESELDYWERYIKGRDNDELLFYLDGFDNCLEKFLTWRR
jgi:hypothetical protein